MSGIVSREGAKSGVVGHMGNVVLLRSEILPSSGPYLVNDIFRPEYRSYCFIFHMMKMATDNVQLQFQFSTDNGSSYVTASHYDSQAFNVTAGGTENPINEDGSDHAVVGGYGNQGATSNEAASGTVWVYDPSNDRGRKHITNDWLIWKYDGVQMRSIGGASYESDNVMDACKFYPNSGNFDVTGNDFGKVSIYGYR